MKTILGLALGLVILSTVVACSSNDESPEADSPGGAVSSAMGPGLSIDEAIASDLAGPLLVNGFLLVNDDTVRFCSGLTDSSPPECSGTSLDVEGIDLSQVEGLTEEGGVSWSSEMTQLLGDIDGGAIKVREDSSA